MEAAVRKPKKDRGRYLKAPLKLLFIQYAIWEVPWLHIWLALQEQEYRSRVKQSKEFKSYSRHPRETSFYNLLITTDCARNNTSNHVANVKRVLLTEKKS